MPLAVVGCLKSVFLLIRDEDMKLMLLLEIGLGAVTAVQIDLLSSRILSIF
jgi:hypothetical protein